MAELDGEHIFSFVRNESAAFQSGCTMFHTHQHPVSDPGSDSLLAFDTISILNFHHSNRWVVTSHCGVHLHFLDV